LEEKLLEDGQKDWNPFLGVKEDGQPWVNPQVKEKGVDLSLDLISRDIDEFLSQA
jgi:hypothetical protein